MYTYSAKITRVIDGDTFICDVDLGFKLWIKDITVRLLNYNAPESKGLEKEFGAIAKSSLKELITNKDITLRTVKTDSFGRYLGEAWLSDGTHLVDSLVSKGLGVHWDGSGDRPKFDMTKSYPIGL